MSTGDAGDAPPHARLGLAATSAASWRARSTATRCPSTTRSSSPRAKGRDAPRAEPRGRRAAAPPGRRRRHVRRQPQHQLHERLHQALHVLRVLAGPPRGGGLFPARRGDRAPRARRRGRSGATEVCIQAGLPPEARRPLLHRPHAARIKRALPDLHLHAFSPEEMLYGTVRSGLSIKDYLTELRRRGSARCPGRRRRSSTRRSATSSRAAASPSTSGSRSSPRRTRSASAPRRPSCTGTSRRPRTGCGTWRCCASIQKDTGGFTEFVPLSLIHSEAPMYAKRLVPDVRPGATGVEVVRMHALARLMLGPDDSATSRRRG